MKTIILSIAVVAVVACTEKQDAQSKVAQAVPAPSVAAEKQAVPAPESAGRITGKVLEAHDAGGYTYVRLGTQAGERWAAVAQTKVAAGQMTSVDVQMVMENFESKSLQRKFDTIAFGTIAGPGNAPPPAMPASEMAAAPKPAASGAAQHMAAPPAPNVTVARAQGENAKTIGELWSARASLSGQTVTVRGKVVKFLGGIMGKNFVHLRDGSKVGDEDADLTVTTDAVVAVGDVVVVKGKVTVDRDFGSGYRYPVIIEDAEVVR